MSSSAMLYHSALMAQMGAKPQPVHPGSIFPNIPRNPNAADWQTELVKKIDDLKAAALESFEKACEGKYLGRVK